MTISSIINRVDSNGNDVTTAFAFPYKFFLAADLIVLDVTVATGVTVTRALTTDYTISGVQDSSGAYPNGATINMVVAPATGHRLTIYRDPAAKQLVQHVDNDDVPAASIDNPLDLLTCIVQRLAERITRSVTQPDSDPAGLTMQLPAAVTRANMFAAFDASGNLIAAAGTSTVPVSAAMSPVVQAASLAAGRTAFGAAASGANADITSLAGLTTINSGPLAGFRNAIINGNFDIWQRGTSFSPSASSNSYAADRWMCFNPSGAAVTISQQAFTAGQTLVPGEPTYFLRQAQTTGGVDPSMNQRIEDVRNFAGQNLTLSFYAKVASGTLPLELLIDQNFGSGGSAHVLTVGATKTITTAFQKFSLTVAVPSVTGKTIGAGSYLQIEFRGPDATIYTLDLARVQVEPGSTASLFETRPLAVELAMCQRYFYAIVSTGAALLATGMAISGTAAKFVMPLLVTPRVPFSAITLSATADFSVMKSDGTAATTTALTFNSSTPNAVGLDATVAAGLTAGQAAILEINTSGKSIQFSGAEL